jgi:hypothetical protein
LARGDAFLGTSTTCEQELAGLLLTALRYLSDRLAGLFGQFKPDRSAGLLLAYGRPISGVSARGDVVDLDRHDIAATKLAVDRQIEHPEVSDATFCRDQS